MPDDMEEQAIIVPLCDFCSNVFLLYRLFFTLIQAFLNLFHKIIARRNIFTTAIKKGDVDESIS